MAFIFAYLFSVSLVVSDCLCKVDSSDFAEAGWLENHFLAHYCALRGVLLMSLVYMIVLFSLTANVFWSRRETARFLFNCEENKRKLPSWFSILVCGEKIDASVSLLGILFCSIVFIPSLLASYAVIIASLIGIVTSFFSFSFSWLEPINVFFVCAAILLYYALGYFFFRMIAKISSTTVTDITLVFVRVLNLPKYVWIFVLLCVPIPIITKGGMLSILSCLVGIVLCLLFMYLAKPNTKTGLMIYVLVVIVAAAWGIAYLLIEIQSTFTL